MKWKYANKENSVVIRTHPNGMQESCLIEAIAGWIKDGNTPEPFVPVELTPEQIYEEQVTAKMVEISDRELRVKAVAELEAVALVK